MNRDDLRALPLFEACSDEDLTRAATLLEPLDVASGTTLMHQGSYGHELIIVLSGSLEVIRDHGGAAKAVARIGDGGFAGELSALYGTPRTATIVATEAARLLVCRAANFDEFLSLGGVAERLGTAGFHRRTVNRAAEVQPVSVTLHDGGEILLRPVLPTDTPAMMRGLDRLSAISLYRRFHSAVVPTESQIAALADVDYPRNFAWAAADRAEPDALVAIARLAHFPGDNDVAEIAIVVVDDYQRRGIGPILLDTLNVTALQLGIARLFALVLGENKPMLRLLSRSGVDIAGRFEAEIEFEYDVPRTLYAIDAETARGVRNAVRIIAGG